VYSINGLIDLKWTTKRSKTRAWGRPQNPRLILNLSSCTWCLKWPLSLPKCFIYLLLSMCGKSLAHFKLPDFTFVKALDGRFIFALKLFPYASVLCTGCPCALWFETMFFSQLQRRRLTITRKKYTLLLFTSMGWDYLNADTNVHIKVIGGCII
jgi:hypothetical protein